MTLSLMKRRSVLMGCALFMTVTAAGSAFAQDKYKPDMPPPYVPASFSVPETCRHKIYCRIQKLLKLLKQIEIEFYLDIRFFIQIQIGPKERVELEERLSRLEDRLLRAGKLSPVIKSEIGVLKDYLKQA
ncbi:MAG: hypothetical protein ACRBBN_10510 [Methyloligellaceae bacterium]